MCSPDESGPDGTSCPTLAASVHVVSRGKSSGQLSPRLIQAIRPTVDGARSSGPIPQSPRRTRFAGRTLRTEVSRRAVTPRLADLGIARISLRVDGAWTGLAQRLREKVLICRRNNGEGRNRTGDTTISETRPFSPEARKSPAKPRHGDPLPLRSIPGDTRGSLWVWDLKGPTRSIGAYAERFARVRRLTARQPRPTAVPDSG